MPKENKYYIENKDKVLKQSKQYYIENRDKVREQKRIAHFKRKYNLSIDQYKQMFISQDGKCAICEIDLKNLSRTNIHIDHDHKTNKIRQLLCRDCNYMIGNAKDNILVLLKAIEYLNKWK